ncbi:MAG: hypothetical protein E8D52_15180 [Nitrospira sp.]|nr:MAG: hypothetical protein E8D52_15180 [Nitrospira sp.]
MKSVSREASEFRTKHASHTTLHAGKPVFGKPLQHKELVGVVAGKDPEDEFEEFYPAVSLSPCIATAA